MTREKGEEARALRSRSEEKEKEERNRNGKRRRGKRLALYARRKDVIKT